VLTIDDGYAGKRDDATGHFTPDSHPRAILLCQIRADGRICIFAEDYRVQTLSDQHLESVLEAHGEPDYAVVDSAAAELRGRLRALGIGTYGKPSDIEESIKVTRRMLAPDANGWRRILVHPRCVHLRAEMASYRYDDKGRPLKQFDHGPDALRYLCHKLRHA
jgi:phage terminase large subunit